MKKVVLPLLIALLLIFSSTACTEEQTPIEEQTAAYPMTVIDASGEEITIEKAPERVISMTPGITETIFALGAGDKLVGRTDYCDYPEEALAISSVGNIFPADEEKILELEPDLVFASTHFGADTNQRFAELGVTVLTIFEEESFDGAYKLIEKVGQALDCGEQAEQLISEMQEMVNEVTQRVSGLEKPSVYYAVDFGEYGDFTAGGDTFIGKTIEMAGGENIAKDVTGWGYNLERLLEVDPDIIIVSKYFEAKDRFLAEEGYKELTAVKEGRVYEFDNNMLDRQGVRNAEGLAMLAGILHP